VLDSLNFSIGLEDHVSKPSHEAADALKKLEALKPLMALSNDQIMDQMFPAIRADGGPDDTAPSA
jgi:hypothetical protein